MENIKFENISTCVTITRDTLEDLREAICDSIQQNFINRLNALGLTRKCPDIKFVEGLGNSVDVVLIGTAGTVVPTDRTVASINYTYDTTNVYLKYTTNSSTGTETTEEINRYTTIIFFTNTSTIQGFAIANPSSLIDNSDGTYSIDVSSEGVTNVVQFKQYDNFIPYEEIINKAYNPDNIDYDNIFIRNKLISNKNCYYELTYTDLTDNNNQFNLPYVNDRLYDIIDIPVAAEGIPPLREYYVCSVLENTPIEYSIDDYPVLFPKTIIDVDNIIKGYIDYVFDVPTQKLDTGDSLNNLYSGQLVNLDGSQYILCDANTIVQVDNLGIVSSSINTIYDGKYHDFGIIYPDLKGVKIFATLTSNSTPLTRDELYTKSMVSSGIHSWYLYDMIPDDDESPMSTTDVDKNVEFANVNAGKYNYLYKICIPFNNFNPSITYNKEEYLRLHKNCSIKNNVVNTTLLNQFYTSYTTQSSAILNANFKIIATFIEIEPPTEISPGKYDLANFEVKPKITTSGSQDVLTHTFNKELFIVDGFIKYDDHSGITLGNILFNNRSFVTQDASHTTLRFGAQIKFSYSGESKDNTIYYMINNEYYTIADTIYVSYDYIPDVYLEYYGYTSVDITESTLVGYYINDNSVYQYDSENPIKYALDYYFISGKITDVSNNNDNINVSLLDDIKLSFAEDILGEPGEWTVVSRTVTSSDGYQHISLAPQYTWGYPRCTYTEQGNIDISDVPVEGKLDDNEDDFKNTTLTKTIWYKIECPNYKTIMDKGELTINGVPLMVRVTDPTDERYGQFVPAYIDGEGNLVPVEIVPEVTPPEPYDPDTDNPETVNVNVPANSDTNPVNNIVPEDPTDEDYTWEEEPEVPSGNNGGE